MKKKNAPVDSNRNADHKFWDRIAETLHTTDGHTAMKLYRQAGLMKADPAPTWRKAEFFLQREAESAGVSREQSQEEFRSIGPWRPQKVGDAVKFVRPPPQDSAGAQDAAWWCLETPNELEIKSDEKTLRICFLGESAAAGACYTPKITPAKVLQSILTQIDCHEGIDQYEVIDLTRNSAWLELLVELGESSFQLKPDVLVFFAGNNFFAPHTIYTDGTAGRPRSEIESASKSGALGLYQNFCSNLRNSVESRLDLLAKKAKDCGVEMVFLIPATNDRWERPTPIPWLGKARTRKWYELYQRGINALGEKQFEEALAIGKEMVSLDGGIGAPSQRIIANALEGRGNVDEIAQYFQHEVDVSNVFEFGLPTPGTHSEAQKAIRHVCEKYKFPCVDSREIFTDYLENPVLGWSLFGDYCHLTPEGMQVAMSAVAAEISSLKSGSAIKWRTILGKVDHYECADVAKARALLHLNIYTSHVHQKLNLSADKENIQTRFEEALQLSSNVSDFMKEYIRFRHSGAIAELSASYQKFLTTNLHPLDAAVGRWVAGIDRFTIEPMIAALQARGMNADDLLTSYQSAYIQSLKEGVELVQPIYFQHFSLVSPVTLEALNLASQSPKIVYAKLPRTDFVIASSKSGPIRCQVTSRLPALNILEREEREGRVQVAVNGIVISEFRISTMWSEHEFIIPVESLEYGFNQLTVHWPQLPSEEESAIDNAIQGFQSGEESRWLPIFGELFSFFCKEAFSS
jgi:hypothetical protein